MRFYVEPIDILLYFLVVEYLNISMVKQYCDKKNI